VEPWQADQAQASIRMPYQECLPLPWARPRPFNDHTIEAAKGMSQRKVFRDEASLAAMIYTHVSNRPGPAVKIPWMSVSDRERMTFVRAKHEAGDSIGR
jgi:hypothetical protein